MVSIGALGHDVDNCDIFVVFRARRVMNMADVIIIYKMKLNNVRCGLNFKIIIIHPRWPIDENAMIFRSCV